MYWLASGITLALKIDMSVLGHAMKNTRLSYYNSAEMCIILQVLFSFH